MKKYRLWEILLLQDEGLLKDGDKFQAEDVPINLIIEYCNGEFVYNTLMEDTTSRKTVTLCSGEMYSLYSKIE